jgi:hypothetical protein
MTRLMGDGIEPAQVPGGFAIYAGYVGGRWPSFEPLAARYPAALHVSIAVNAAEDARVLDVETGDATPAEAPGWAARQRAAGNPYPVIYCNTSTWPAVQVAFAEQGVPAPLYWVAAYLSQAPNLAALPAIPAGAIALQCYDYGGYDLSVVADYWPGLDPAPVPPSQTIVLEEEPVQIEPLSVHAGDYAIAANPNVSMITLVADGDSGAPADLRIAAWVGNNPIVEIIHVGGSAGHSVGHNLPQGCDGVTIKRQDAGGFAVGVALH